MKISFLTMLFPVLLLSCKGEQAQSDGSDGKGQVERDEGGSQESRVQLREYMSEKWGVAFKYPDSLEVYEGQLPAKSPVINIYDPDNSGKPPFAIHENAAEIYIAILPQGYGVDGPGGERISIADWSGSLSVSFSVDEGNSRVYLLENGKPWGFSLRFHNPPEGWNDYGSIFVHHGVADFRTECIDTTSGEVKDMQNCDPLAGEDRVLYYGDIRPGSKKALNVVLENMYFIDEDSERKPISDLLQIEHPKPGEEVSSPLEIKGKTRGYWLFEGQAPFKLVDEDYEELTRGHVTAQKDWMTEDFVPIEATLTFEPPQKEKGYLVLNRANPSGKPEKDRSFRLPVKFSQ